MLSQYIYVLMFKLYMQSELYLVYGSVTINGTDGGRNPGVITGSQRIAVDAKATVSISSDGSFMFQHAYMSRDGWG